MKNFFSFFTSPKNIIKTFWMGFGSIIFSLFLLTYSVRGNWFGLFGEIPGFEVLENPKSDLATIIYADGGKEILGKYYKTNRTNVAFDEISNYVITTLIATEDERYEQHGGVDMRSTIRVLKGVATGHLAGGGSTVSQQLAKNLFKMRQEPEFKGVLYKTPLKPFIIKAKEWITAISLERSYTKEEIITMYLNTVNFGIKAVGINEGAKTYFNKKASQLTLNEAATLVGTLKANYKYDPQYNPENAIGRRKVVLGQILRFCETNNLTILTKEKKEQLDAEPLGLDFNLQNDYSGRATHFRTTIRNELRAIAKENGLDLDKDGLKIYTTIDYNAQKKAEIALGNHMQYLQQKVLKEWGKTDPWSDKYFQKELKKQGFYKAIHSKHNGNPAKIKKELSTPISYKVPVFEKGKILTIKKQLSPIAYFKYMKKFLHAGFLAVEPSTGAVKAWVGGVDQQYFAYDHVQQGRRQVGSTFKPILYSTAINLGYSPCYEMHDVPVVARTDDDKIWMPNIKATNEILTLKQCLGRSLNNCAAKLMRDIGPERVIEHAKLLGLPASQLKANLSLALGTCELNMFELIGPYMSFVNQGTMVKPHYITKITDKHGKVLWQHIPTQKKVMSEVNAYKMVTLLRSGITDPKGTGRALDTKYNLLANNNQLGGKTGTTQDSKDGWFVGVNNELVCITWVGVEDNQISFKNSRGWYGGSMALPIYANFMKSMYKSKIINPTPFKVPESLDESTLKSDLQCVSDSTLLGDSGIEK